MRRCARFLTVALAALAALLTVGSVCVAQSAQQSSPPPKSTGKQGDAQTHPTPDEELQQAIDNAGNDRAALVRNLEAFLQKYPEAPQRTRIYRALVESNTSTPRQRARNELCGAHHRAQSRRHFDELIAIQLLEQNGDEAGLKRAVSYSTRVLDFVNRPSDEKSPKVSQEEFVASKNHDRMTVLVFRGRLDLKLHENAKAEKDFEDAYAFEPSAVAAEKMGEIAELNKDLPRAIQQYARAFSLVEGSKSARNAAKRGRNSATSGASRMDRTMVSAPIC